MALVQPTRRLVFSLPLLALTVCLLSSETCRAANHIAYPDPTPDAYIKLDGDPLNREFYFTDLDVNDGGNPIGSQFHILFKEDDGTPLSYPADVVDTLLDNSNGEQRIGWDSSIGNIRRDRVFLWRVDVEDPGGTVITGHEWRVDVPMEAPTDGAQNVSVYVKFEWDPNPDAPLNTRYEKLFITRVSGWNGRWTDVNGNPRGDLLKKTFDANATSGRNALREFWWLDSGYSRLDAGYTYYWRLGYYDQNNKFLGFWDVWSLRTVPQASTVISDTIESVVIYWHHPQGDRPRDPPERRASFYDEAEKLETIHEQHHGPSVSTYIINHESIVAAYTDSELVPEITQWPGWYSYTRTARNNSPHYFSYDEQDRYQEWTARAIRTWLRDSAGWVPPNGPASRGHSHLPNLQYVILLGDCEHVAASFYANTNQRATWVATDLFYTTQDDGAGPNTQPHFQVSRIPMRRVFIHTVDQDNALYAPAVPAGDNLPVLITNGGSLAHPTIRTWRMPYLSKIARYAELLNSESRKEDAYDLWFGRQVWVSGVRDALTWYPYSPGTTQNILGRRLPAPSSRDIFSGLLVRHYNIFGEEGTEEALTNTNVRRHIRTTISDQQPGDPGSIPGLVYHNGSGSTDGLYLAGAGHLWDTDFADEFGLDPAFDDVDQGRRSLLLSAGGYAASFDTSIFSQGHSYGERAVLDHQGPITMIGRAGPQWIGYTPQITEGVLSHSYLGDPDIGTRLSTELLDLFARSYASTTQAVIGNLFNKALSTYIERHGQGGIPTGQSEMETIFGFNMLGDCALVMPMRQPAAKDNTRPTLTDINPRAATVIGDYGTTAQYNSQDIPIHTITRTEPYDPNNGVRVDIQIECTAPWIRVRVLTPFLQNNGENPGRWFDTTEVTQNQTEIYQTVEGKYTYSFIAKTPSIYIVVVQDQNAAWSGGDPAEWRWLKERWIYVQVVNQFERNADNNILVVDVDQHDRFHLNGNYQSNRERYYINPALDGEGYAAGSDPRNLSRKPALAILNKELGEDIGDEAKYKYHYWSTNNYHTNLGSDGNTIKEQQRYYGEIIPEVVKSFADTRGVILWYTGDLMGSASPPTHNPYLGFPYDTFEEVDRTNLKAFLDHGGRLFLTSQELQVEAGPLLTDPGYLGSLDRTQDTDFTNMDGLQIGTLSEKITDVNAAGGDGADNATWTGEVDPNAPVAATIFVWDETSGPGTVTGTGGSAVQNRLATSGGRTVFFAWPFEAIDHIGNLGADDSGRENVMRRVVDWIRSVPKASNPDPADGAGGVPLDKTLSWNRVSEAADYRICISTDPNDLGAPVAVIDRDNPQYTPGNLVADTHYYWRVDCRNVDDYTTGDIWDFITQAPPPPSQNPDPADGATQIPLDQVFAWINVGTVSTYDVWMWTAADGDDTFDPENAPDPDQYHVGDGLTSAQYTPASNLLADTQYYWRVDAHNTVGDSQSAVWDFHTITIPDAPITPDPTSGGANVPTSKVFGWGMDAASERRTDSYDVFIWLASATAPAADEDVSSFNNWSGNTTDKSWSPPELDTDADYRWEVRPRNAAGRNNSVTTWTFHTAATTAAPPPVSNPSPANGATDVNPNTSLSWTASGYTAFDIYIWLTSDPEPTTPTVADHATTSYTPGTALNSNTQYNWRVNAKNSVGDETAGPVWTFTTGQGVTPPAKVTGYSPADGATDVDPNVTLSWDPAQDADTYDVYFGKDALPGTPNDNTSQTQWDPPAKPLEKGATYHWRVDSVATDGVTKTQGDELTFTVRAAPDKVSGMTPADGATDVNPDVLLNWNDAGGADSYDVYLEKDALPATRTANVTPSQYQPPAELEQGATYHWRVDSVDTDATTVQGDEYTFTVRLGPAKVTGMTPADGATDVSSNVLLDWDDADDATSYDVYLGKDALPATPVNVTPSQYQTSNLENDATYHWRIDSRDGAGQTTQGDEYTFTVEPAPPPPGKVGGHSPADGATGVAADVLLDWDPAAGASTYDLYLGMNVLPGTPTAAGIGFTEYQPPTPLEAGATYVWRVDSIAADGVTKTLGDILTFVVAAGGGGGGGGSIICFVATSALETRGAPDGVPRVNCTGSYLITPERLKKLDAIRALRDDVLLQLPVGRSFSTWYYALGPYAATAIRGREPAKAAVRKMLLGPLYELSRAYVEESDHR